MTVRSIVLLTGMLTLATVTGCEVADGNTADAEESAAAALAAGRTPAYRDVEVSFTSEEEQDRWFGLKRGLRADFDDICGDTFCEGDFTNLQALSFRCSVGTRTGS